MSPVFALRLCLDLLAAGLLTFGLSYWWLGDSVHEATGMALFALLIVHNVFNRRWYGQVARARRTPPSLFNIAVTIALAASMTTVVVSSAMLATFLPEWISPGIAGTARQAHVLAAYWAFVIVAVHLGSRWAVIMGVARWLFRISRPNRSRTHALRLAAALIAAGGIWSFSVLQLGNRLANRVSLEWWDFDASVLGFFVHCSSAAGMFIVVSHYSTVLLRATHRDRPMTA